jgi:hypothetical protein
MMRLPAQAVPSEDNMKAPWWEMAPKACGDLTQGWTDSTNALRYTTLLLVRSSFVRLDLNTW